ncbi:MAG TPA: efflux RND transporter periplasmic adaptor subunit, partial [Gemmataceae bacterium]|nr:efflux RND transporter periplasmic adaptor subunit [Gemmataceae bacterium]
TALAGCARKPAPATEQAPPRVTVAPAVADDNVIDFEDFTGRTEPYRVVEIRPQVTAALERVYFEDGEYVNAGDPLFDLDNAIFVAQRDSAKASRELAIAQVGLKKELMATGEEAYRRGSLSKEELATRAAELKVAEATEEVARSNLARAETTLSYTRITAPLSGRLSRRRVDPGNIVKENETVLTTLVILDPVYVTFDIDERTLLQIRSRVIRDGGTSPSIRGGQLKVKVRLSDRLSAKDEDYKKDWDEFDAIVRFADNVLDPNTGTLRLRADLDNPRLRAEKWLRFQPGPLPAVVGAAGAMRLEDRVTRLISPGMFVRVRFPVGRPYRGTLIPEEAISSEQGRKFVYVVRNPTDTGETEKKEEVVNGQKAKVEYAVWKGTPEPRWVSTGPQLERMVLARPVAYRVVGVAGEKNPAVAEKDLVIVTGLQRVRKTKDGNYVDVTWLVRKDTTFAAK